MFGDLSSSSPRSAVALGPRAYLGVVALRVPVVPPRAAVLD